MHLGLIVCIWYHQRKCNEGTLDSRYEPAHIAGIRGGFSICLRSSTAERTLEAGETEVRFLSKAHALVAQWIERAVSGGKIAGSNPAEGTRDF